MVLKILFGVVLREGEVFMLQIYTDYIPYRARIVFCFLLACLIGCTPSSNNGTVVSQLAVTAPTATATVQPLVSIPAPQPRPDFVRYVSPLESAAVPLSLFESPGDPNISIDSPSDGRPAGFPISGQGYNSKVCIEINLTPLVQSTDDLTAFDKIESRITFIVDEYELDDPNLIYFRTDLEEDIIVADDGVTQWIGPFTSCWTAELLAGVHQATIQFEQTSGDIQSYSWHFIIVDG